MAAELNKIQFNIESAFNFVDKDLVINSLEKNVLVLIGLGVFANSFKKEGSAGLAAETEAMKAEISALRNELNRPNGLYELQQAILSRDIELETLKARNEIFTQPISRYKKQLDNKVIEMANMKRSFEDMLAANEETRIECHNMNTTLRSANQELEFRNSDLATKVASLKNRVSEMAEELAQIRSKNMMIAGSQLLDNEMEHIKNEIVEWSSLAAEPESALEVNRQYFERLKEWLRQYMDKLDEKIIDYRRQYEAFKQDLEISHQEELSDLQTKHGNELHRLRANHEKNIESLHELYRDQLADKDRQIEENLGLLKSRNDRDHATLDDMQMECSNVAESLRAKFASQYDNDMRFVKNVLTMAERVQYDEAVNSLQQELSAAHNRLSAMQEQYDRLSILKTEAENALQLARSNDQSSTAVAVVDADREEYIGHLEARIGQFEEKVAEMEHTMRNTYRAYKEELDNLQASYTLSLQQNNISNTHMTQTIIQPDALARQRVLELENENAVLADKLDDSLAQNKLLKAQNEKEREQVLKYKDAIWKINSGVNYDSLSSDTQTNELDKEFHETFLAMVRARQMPAPMAQRRLIEPYLEKIRPEDKVWFVQFILSIFTLNASTYNEEHIDFDRQYEKTIHLLFRIAENFNPQQLVDYFNDIDPVQGSPKRLLPLQNFVLSRPFELQSNMYNGVCKRVMDVGMLVKSLALYKSSMLDMTIRGRNAAGKATKNRISIFADKPYSDLLSMKTTPRGKIARRIATGSNL